MAEIRKIIPRPSLSDFSRVAPSGGTAFKVLADVADAAYERFLPAAKDKLEAEGTAVGREMARRQFGNPGSYAGGGSPFRAALRMSESGGNSSVVNAEGYGGLYQWGPDRLADYNRATGQNITFQQFVGDASLQEKAQDWHEGDILGALGGYVGRTVNGQVLDEAAIIGMAHLGGIGGAKRFIESGGTYDPADSNGTSLSDYARKFGGLAVGGEPVEVRKADGTVEPRLYSPLSGDLLQVHNAAAGVAYASEAMLKGATDLFAISEQYPLNPDGYRQAADAYIDQIVSQAPEPFREDLRSELTDQARSRFLGMVEERQKDTRERAANSSAALTERWADNLAEAIAGGNPVSAGRAEAKLRNILAARETLPGLAWTADDSENVIIKARQRAEEVVKERRKAESDGWKGTLNAIIDAAKNGLRGADETLLLDPRVQAEHLELVREGIAQTTFRDALPSFNAAPKAERDAAVAQLKANPISEDYQIDIVKAAEAANKAVTDAFEADPIKAATDYLPQKPPPLPDMSLPPDQIVAAFAARREYADRLTAGGYARKTAYLTAEEAKTVGALFGKDVPVELRLAASTFITEGFGDAAGQVFKALPGVDAATRVAGGMAAVGLTESANQVMLGRAMMDAGQVPNRFKYASVAAVSPALSEAIDLLPPGLRNEQEVLEAAAAIYAYQNPEAFEGDGKDDKQRKAAEKAISIAMGENTNPTTGEVKGGVQTILNRPVLLPVDVAAADVQAAMERAYDPIRLASALDQTANAVTGLVPPEIEAQRWAPLMAAGVGSSAGSAPMQAGVPVDPKFFKNGNIRIRPLGGENRYTLDYVAQDGTTVEIRDASGGVYQFDIKKLVEAAR